MTADIIYKRICIHIYIYCNIIPTAPKKEAASGIRTYHHNREVMGVGHTFTFTVTGNKPPSPHLFKKFDSFYTYKCTTKNAQKFSINIFHYVYFSNVCRKVSAHSDDLHSEREKSGDKIACYNISFAVQIRGKKI